MVAKIEPEAAPELYLDLLKKCLTRSVFTEEFHLIEPPTRSVLGVLYEPVRRALSLGDLSLVRRVDVETARQGNRWPATAETMLGEARLDNIQGCVRQVLEDDVPGDLMEAGVWRGGATILMRATLAAYGDAQRRVWVADSFRGLPRPDAARCPVEAGDKLWARRQLAVPVEQVKANFARYGLLDDRVRFLVGWFSDTMPTAPIERLAVLRVDGDLYESTRDVLVHLYPKLSPGGYLIVDDYLNEKTPGCRLAVDDYRAEAGIVEPLTEVDWTAVFWRKAAESAD